MSNKSKQSTRIDERLDILIDKLDRVSTNLALAMAEANGTLGRIAGNLDLLTDTSMTAREHA